ncbi:TetR/AcrR family transcriptional regulator [Reichenbachiella versicolor]|uniref:TetR/AcrR family transcriptional regulator n=1 Tax=Reichenbachiella versicolor TaxID=1821036 RepID=UPI000D6EA0FD|nr:TetR/AcrR family transcriptional regulator [Reichenbachiella versicolor]
MSSTQEEILKLGESLICTKGYTGFSYKDISVPLGIKNAAIHYHFPSKADLGIEVIRLNQERFQELKETVQDNSPAEKIDALVNLYRSNHEKGYLCITAALSPSFESLPDEMKEELTSYTNDLRQWLTNALLEGKELGQFGFEGDIRSMADQMLGSFISSLVLERVTSEPILDKVISELLGSE